MKKPSSKFRGKIEDGKIQVYNKEAFNDVRRALEGTEITLELKSYSKPRTNKENRYYWGVVISILSDEIGYDREEMHEALKFKFLPVDHGPLPTCRSSASLSIRDFEQYLSEIRTWASMEMNIYIPLPNEVEVYDDFTFSLIHDDIQYQS